MSRLSIRAKRAAKKFKGRSLIEVDRIIKRTPSFWDAHVTYTYGTTMWQETVTFALTKITRMLVLVTVYDTEYPNDRIAQCEIHRDTDMPSFITSFLVSGRW